MTRGPVAAPKITLTEAFRQRIREAMGNGHPGWLLSALAGFPAPTDLSGLLYAKQFAGTPRIRGRFQIIADVLGFKGELFAEVPK
jgi:hypothetical protein